jgi:hypothetical protein
LNDLAKQARADHIIHTGDFGFYDDTSLERIADKYVPRERSLLFSLGLETSLTHDRKTFGSNTLKIGGFS